jgi:uncharacterized protein GlcG (DUF336 family)
VTGADPGRGLRGRHVNFWLKLNCIFMNMKTDGLAATSLGPTTGDRSMNHARSSMIAMCLAAASVISAPTAASDALVEFKILSLDIAQKAASATLEACRSGGFQVTVAVVDRFGNLQVLLRDRFAGAHTPDSARRKAWTAVSFRTGTTELASLTQPGQPQSAARDISDALMLGGGITVEAGGSIVAGIGVSGAPTGEQDDACALAGREAIVGDIEL